MLLLSKAIITLQVADSSSWVTLRGSWSHPQQMGAAKGITPIWTWVAQGEVVARRERKSTCIKIALTLRGSNPANSKCPLWLESVGTKWNKCTFLTLTHTMGLLKVTKTSMTVSFWRKKVQSLWRNLRTTLNLWPLSRTKALILLNSSNKTQFVVILL